MRSSAKPTTAQKCAKPRNATSSLKESHTSKRPRIDQGSYAQMAKGIISTVLTLSDSPDNKIEADEVTNIRKLIRKYILDLPEDTRDNSSFHWTMGNR